MQAAYAHEYEGICRRKWLRDEHLQCPRTQTLGDDLLLPHELVHHVLHTKNKPLNFLYTVVPNLSYLSVASIFLVSKDTSLAQDLVNISRPTLNPMPKWTGFLTILREFIFIFRVSRSWMSKRRNDFLNFNSTLSLPSSSDSSTCL